MGFDACSSGELTGKAVAAWQALLSSCQPETLGWAEAPVGGAADADCVLGVTCPSSMRSLQWPLLCWLAEGLGCLQ